MSCVKVAIMTSGFHQSLSLQQTMSYRAWNTIPINSPTSPVNRSPSTMNRAPSMLSPVQRTASSSYHHHSRGYASEIIPRLYISDLSFAENPAQLAAHRITHILSTLPETIATPPGFPVQRLQIKVEDFPFAELAAHLPCTTKFIRDALQRDPEARVLVHCAEGVSRSVSVVAAFLMAVYGWNPKEALSYIKERRGVANPNFGFVQQLHEYGRDVLGQRGVS
ncbi:protein-tyrosine phosphatase-like protein [Mycena floridula]|nr:protein-tyrosine phosphatase-like protein [Mycena floridula]